MGDTGAKMTSRHQAVVDRLRTRIGQYKKHHLDVQNKYESSLPAMEKMDRHQAMVLQQRVLVDRERKLLKGKQQDEIKPEQPPNGVDTKSTNAILQQHLKRKSLNNPHSLLCVNEKENGSGECRSKRQREDIAAAFPLHSREQQINSSSSQHEKSGNIPGHPVDSSMNYPGGSTALSSVNPGAQVSATTSPGLGGFSTDGSSLQSSDFKQENQVTMSCEEATCGAQNSTCSNEAGQPGQSTAKYVGTYLAQELIDFERVFQGYKKAAEEKRTSDVDDLRRLGMNVTSQGQETSGKQRANLVTQHEVEQNQRIQGSSLQVQLTNRQVGPPRLQEFAHESSLPLTSSRTQGRSFMVSEGQTHSQYSSEHAQLMEDRQDIPQRASFQPNLFSAFGSTSQLPSENLQGYPVRNQAMAHNQNDPLLFHRTSQTRNSQQTVYSFPQQQNLSSKLSHPPLEGQLRPSFPHFQNAQVVPSSMGRASAPPMGPMPAQDLSRLSGAMYTSSQVQQRPLYQRQQSVPSIPRQPFIGMEPLQQDIQPFPTSDQHLFSNTQQGLQASYHYQRRNSFPLYQRSNMQPALRGFAQNSQQMNSLPSGLQTSGSKFGPPMPVSSGPRMQVNPYQGVRASADLPHSTHVVSSGFYKGQNRQDVVTSLPQPTHAGRKITNGGVYQYSTNPSIPARSAGDVGQSSFSGRLVKAPSFASLLEQSSVNQGNLETTYTGSIPNLDLLGEILGP